MNKNILLILGGIGLMFATFKARANIYQGAEAIVLPDDPTLFDQVEVMLSNIGGNMNISQRGIDLIKAFEGFRSRVYDANPPTNDLTIGYGHKLKLGEQFPDEITEHQAEIVLLSDLSNAIERVNSQIKIPLNQNQFDALVSAAFNLSTTAWLQMAARINKGQAPERVFMLYVRGGGRVLTGLVNRRNAELQLYLA